MIKGYHFFFYWFNYLFIKNSGKTSGYFNVKNKLPNFEIDKENLSNYEIYYFSNSRYDERKKTVDRTFFELVYFYYLKISIESSSSYLGFFYPEYFSTLHLFLH